MSDLQALSDLNHFIDAHTFRQSLLSWGKEHFRSFPWRQTGDPYHILMAEIMLHRTQARQVVPVYEAFIARYPTVALLAQASREQLHQILYSLGLRWRIDLIQNMAQELMSRFGGQVPQEKAPLLSLPGVSEYIASAVRCFAWNLPEPLIDTNVVRILGRLFGLETRDSSRRSRLFQHLAATLVDPEQPRRYTYALLDLADQICMKKRLPLCKTCPVRAQCSYGLAAVAGNIQRGKTHDDGR
ncbi:DNA-binding protein [Thermogemmatispora onikobensis]|uniref:DNA-binding protein n=1 Tax=Thermogemmatispora onikobensis TaxID=732234 RepID=UPI0008532867|nr:DNA-binding protein [Thermogemmatispora onikobensis]